MVQIASADSATADIAVATATATAQEVARAATTLELLDFEVIAYNNFGGTVTTDAPELTLIAAVTPQADGKSFTMQLAVS